METRDDVWCLPHGERPLSAGVIAGQLDTGLSPHTRHPAPPPEEIAMRLCVCSPPFFLGVRPQSLLSGSTVQGVTSDYGAAGQTMEQSVLGGWRCWGRRRLEKAKLSCPRGLRLVRRQPAPEQASEEPNRDGLEREGNGEGEPTDAGREGARVQCRQEGR